MNPETPNKYIRVHKLTLGIVALVLIAGILGWWLGHSNSSPNAASPSNTSNTQPSTANSTPSSDVSALIQYVLPDGWKQIACSENKTTYVTPNGTATDCSNPSAPIKLLVDINNTKDCNQLQNQTNVKKHVCKSLFINGHKSLKASTEYQTNTVDTYYIDTGKGVVQLEYTHTDDQFMDGFDQLANSVHVK